MQHGSTTSRDTHTHLQDTQDNDVVRLVSAKDAAPSVPRLSLTAEAMMSITHRSATIASLKKVSAKAFSIYSITEFCAEQGDYTETHNEHIGSLALELYEALQALGIHLSE